MWLHEVQQKLRWDHKTIRLESLSEFQGGEGILFISHDLYSDLFAEEHIKHFQPAARLTMARFMVGTYKGVVVVSDVYEREGGPSTCDKSRNTLLLFRPM